MIDELVAVRFGHLVLQLFDLLVRELDYFARFDTYHVIVMLTVVELEHRMTTLEIVARHEPGCLELGQHPVHGREADVLTRVQQLLVHVLCAQVALPRFLENLENLESRQGDLEAGFTKFLALLH